MIKIFGNYIVYDLQPIYRLNGNLFSNDIRVFVFLLLLIIKKIMGSNFIYSQTQKEDLYSIDRSNNTISIFKW